ncbi:MAG: HNH endonuclease [Clostridia bacterium]|nr:HNH endonuclease [Clostridia bacterium]
MEIWKDIIETSNYAVSSLGRIKNTKTNRLLNPSELGNGYKQVSLKMNDTGKFKKEYIHRLVAKYFIENPDNKKEVNHKDGNKNNNNMDNLEWVTPSENQKHKYDVLKSKTSNRLIGQYTKDDKFI